MRTIDSELQRRVMDELEREACTQQAQVGVQVRGGVVTLTGVLGSEAERLAVQQATHRALGVLDVANDIIVRRTAASDTEIARAVRHALLWAEFVPQQCIHSTVSNGKVTLEGEVTCPSERDDAEWAVRELAGVACVSNQITIKQPSAERSVVRLQARELVRPADASSQAPAARAS